MQESHDISIPTPAAPGNAATITLWDSTSPFLVSGRRNFIQQNGIRWYTVSFLSLSHASNAAGLGFYASSDAGTNYDLIEAAISVAVSVAGTVVSYRRPISMYDEFKVTYVNGATLPTTWRVTQMLTVGDNAKVT